MVLFAFLHSLVAGCMKTTTVQQPKINVESTECCIYEVILITGEKYEFKRPGGRNFSINYGTNNKNAGQTYYVVLCT